MKMYAVIDPNWGEPKPVVSTLSESEDGAKAMAVNVEELAPYSGAVFSTVPPKPGNWKKMREYGFDAGPVRVEMSNH